MTRNGGGRIECALCGEAKLPEEVVSAEVIHGGVLELVQRERPDWTAEGMVCRSCQRSWRARYVTDALERERGEVSELEQDVIRSLREQELVTHDVNAEIDERLTLGQRIADKVAEFGGSWAFIVAFALVMAAWMSWNVAGARERAFDPYPFILLNLVLSTLAALQAPVIMMSQNRQEQKDRIRAEHDFRVNLKAELEIRHLHAKVDQLLTRQWQRLMEIQRIQTELLDELARSRRK